MRITSSSGIALGVLALTTACASTQARPSATQAPAAASTATATEAGGVPRSVLERYVGEYQLNPQVTAVVRLRGNTLIREIMGQQQVFTPISETRFKLGGGEVEFVTDQAGKVTMVVRTGVEEKRYPRK